MSLTVTPITRSVFGNKRVVLAEVTFDSSYASNGEDLTPATLGLGSVDAIFTDGAKGWSVTYDKANSKLLAYAATPGSEAAGSANLSALVVNILAIGS